MAMQMNRAGADRPIEVLDLSWSSVESRSLGKDASTIAKETYS